MSNDELVEFSVRLPKGMHKQLAAVAKREFSSLNREVTIAVRAHLDADKRAKGAR